jgi:hypothetical protein
MSFIIVYGFAVVLAIGVYLFLRFAVWHDAKQNAKEAKV